MVNVGLGYRWGCMENGGKVKEKFFYFWGRVKNYFGLRLIVVIIVGRGVELYKIY